jgi:hypothetical protein
VKPNEGDLESKVPDGDHLPESKDEPTESAEFHGIILSRDPASARFGSDACHLMIAHSAWKTAKNQQRYHRKAGSARELVITAHLESNGGPGRGVPLIDFTGAGNCPREFRKPKMGNAVIKTFSLPRRASLLHIGRINR